MEKYPLRSESLKSFLPSFLEVQKSLKNVNANRSGQFKARKFKYADLDEVMKIIRPAIQENNLVLSHSQCFDLETQTFMLYTKVIHISNEFIASLAPIMISNIDRETLNTGDLQKAIGSAITYQAKYSTRYLFAITIEDDPDDNDGNISYKNNSGHGKITTGQTKFLASLMQQNIKKGAEIMHKANIKSIEEMTFQQASAAITELK